ncbi:MAG: hypothetical protein IT235_06685, partial [Bacteroidia bacterium]|nr:hypothetical protein [Bacteroidia bacterium]
MVCTKSDCYLRITGYIGLTRGIIQHQLHRLGLSSVSLQEQKQNLLEPTPTYFFKWYRNIPLLISGVVLFLLSYLLYTPSTTDRSSALKNFEAALHKKELQVEQELMLLSAHASNKTYTQLFSEKPKYYNELYREFGYVLLIYENDTLKFWTDNSPAVENQMKTVCLDDLV